MTSLKMVKQYLKYVLDANSMKNYLKWYQKNMIQFDNKWGGINSIKFPCDMWNYQEIIVERNITTIIECGSHHGGSGLFFAHLLKSLNRKGVVLEIDIKDRWQEGSDHELITRVLSSSTSDIAIKKMDEIISNSVGSVFVILDSLHKKNHVITELEEITPLLRSDDYLIIEDTTFNKGTMSAVVDYMRDNPNQYTHDIAREKKFGVTLAKYGYWIKK